MAVENNIDNIASSAIYINSLTKANPDGSDSEVRELDNHTRGIKNCILNTWAYITGAVTASHTELNLLTGKTDVAVAADITAATANKIEATDYASGSTGGTIKYSVSGTTLTLNNS